MKKQLLALAACGLILLSSCKKDLAFITKGTPYNLDTGSKISWKAGAGAGQVNEGTVDVEGLKNSSGYDFDVVNDEIVSGTFKVAVSSINVTNLPPELKAALENHLKTADFFYMVMHPTVTFTIKSGKPTAANVTSTANYHIKGEMTLLGNTHPLEFPAFVVIKDGILKIKANFIFDQTKWGMNYHVDPYYPEIDRILPGVSLNFDLTANAKYQGMR